MKKQIFTTIAFALFTIGCMHAQHIQETGPLAKNRKPWKDPKPSTPIMIKKHEKLTGPLAKNRKPWKDECELQPIVFVERKSLQGPMAKNVRPERDNYFEDYTR
ncbi:hypothetical protein [Muricauda sp. MAR_2010_75]|jgi:hypothetical protein|uniref:hypothetical protein n=1 Tax=Allomuricauda sp. MAR_2010_75 TaxID=1250232 RepID=UPI00056791D8|nr:hypothetical protein [Muricauda sp. MAR_2010_75]